VYESHNGVPVVISASTTVVKSNLDKGTDTTSCTQDYSRSLDDDGVQDCDAGHILANRLGGSGNQPINIFPQVRNTSTAAFGSSSTKPYAYSYPILFSSGLCRI
jgi:hypothetical protein